MTVRWSKVGTREPEDFLSLPDDGATVLWENLLLFMVCHGFSSCDQYHRFLDCVGMRLVNAVQVRINMSLIVPK